MSRINAFQTLFILIFIIRVVTFRPRRALILNTPVWLLRDIGGEWEERGTIANSPSENLTGFPENRNQTSCFLTTFDCLDIRNRPNPPEKDVFFCNFHELSELRLFNDSDFICVKGI